jgi:glucokinase
MIKTAIGVDIGGGSVKLGLVDSRGKILARESFLTGSAPTKEKFLDVLVAHVLDLQKIAVSRKLEFLGVGIGAPGPIDVERGFVYFFPNIPGWKNTPLKSLLERRLKMPVRVDNDANVMALAESIFGAGRGCQSVLALTLGTGVGGGIVMGGKLFHGPAYSAAEVGHLIINETGPLCSCGNRGCLEAYVGSGYFVKEVARRLKAGEKSVLKKWIGSDFTGLTPLLVAQAAKQGDAFSKKIWAQTGAHLGTALAGLANILNPQKIILGGGIAQNGRILLDPLNASLKKKAFPIAARSVKVVGAKLGVDAGLIGAAGLLF